MKQRKRTPPAPRVLRDVGLVRATGGQHVDNPGQTPMKIKDPEQR